MPSDQPTRCAVVLVGHGAPATDCPPELVGELMALEWRGDRAPAEAPKLESRLAELDTAIRGWPRTPRNDPYKTGLERLADTLRPLLPTDLLAVAYNEFCRPSIREAIEQAIGQGAGKVLVVPTMMTPGGIHSERDIPQALQEVRRLHPEVVITYLWPFELRQVAELLAAHVRSALEDRRQR